MKHVAGIFISKRKQQNWIYSNLVAVVNNMVLYKNMSDFERVDAFFGDTSFEQINATAFRQIRIDLGSAAIYWAAIDLDHPKPAETLRAIILDVRRDITIAHCRHFNKLRSNRFEDSVSISQGMGGEGMFHPDDIYHEDEVAEFRERHSISANTTLSYMGIYPPDADMVSNFSFDMKGRIYFPRNSEVTITRFNEVMEYLEAHKTITADTKA